MWHSAEAENPRQQISQRLKDDIIESIITYQLVPPNYHRQNIVKKVI